MKCVFGHAKTKCIFLVFDKIQKSTIFMNKDKKKKPNFVRVSRQKVLSDTN